MRDLEKYPVTKQEVLALLKEVMAIFAKEEQAPGDTNLICLAVAIDIVGKTDIYKDLGVDFSVHNRHAYGTDLR